MSSAYELARLKNIASNNATLKKMGLGSINRSLRPIQKPVAQKKTSTKRKAANLRRKSSTQPPPRRSSRHRKPVKYTGMSSNTQNNDSDYDDSEAESDDFEVLAPPKKIQKVTTLSQQEGTSPEKHTAWFTVQNAKTGRSSCRACRECIPKGSPRVGMISWIVGRSAMTWQHPTCFLNQLCVSASNGRHKCKVTNAMIPKNQCKIGCRSHTTTTWVSLEAFPELMVGVLDAVATDHPKMPRQLDGVETLNATQHQDLQHALKRCENALGTNATSRNIKVDATKTATQGRKKKAAVPVTKKPQPAAGVKTNAKGNVTWKFGAYMCHGSLISSKETFTHCYARTHKGNVKTLKKGGTYWSMDD